MARLRQHVPERGRPAEGDVLRGRPDRRQDLREHRLAAEEHCRPRVEQSVRPCNRARAIIRAMSPGWKERYAHIVLPRDEALAKIQRGARIFVGSGCAQPQYLVQGLASHPSAVADSEILHMLTLGSA